MQEFIREIIKEFPQTLVKEQESLAKYTSFQIGGPAELLLMPQSLSDIPQILSMIRRYDLPLHILGGGSNLLISDGGVRGVVLRVTCGEISRQNETDLLVGAGCAKAATAVFAQKNGLAGLEFLHGIPGTLGGGILMNAGAYGGDLSQVVTHVTVCDRSGECRELCAAQLQFGYRHSLLQNHREWTVLNVGLALVQDDPQVIRARMEEFLHRRRERQPLSYPSAGSTFKRPAGFFAGKLIEDSGLKGYRVGGACVSEKHAGFVINCGGATCEDVRRVIEHVQETVLRTFGVELECEIEMW